MTSRQRWTLVATIIGSGAVFLDGTVVNAALPRIGRDLPATFVGVLEGQTYVISGYLAVLAAFLILAGALSDHYGRRRVYAIGLAGFAITSGLCGLAPTLEVLVLARLLQGAAGALMVPGALSIITQTFPGPQRGRALGLWTSAPPAPAAVGPPAARRGTAARRRVRPGDVGDIGPGAGRSPAGRPACRYDRVARRLPDQRT